MCEKAEDPLCKSGTQAVEKRSRPQNTEELYAEYQRDYRNILQKLERIELDVSQGTNQNFNKLLQHQQMISRDLLDLQRETTQGMTILKEVVQDLSKCLSHIHTSGNFSNQVPKIPTAADGPSFLPEEDTKASKDVGPTPFGLFLYELSSQLTCDLTKDLALVFDFSPAESDKVRNDYSYFIILLREKGIIRVSDISPLINALHSIKQVAVAETVRKLYDPQTV